MNGQNWPEQSWNSDQEYLELWERSNVHYLLGWNEPDQTHVEGLDGNYKLDPDQAAEQWVFVQKIANQFDPPLK